MLGYTKRLTSVYLVANHSLDSLSKLRSSFPISNPLRYFYTNSEIWILASGTGSTKCNLKLIVKPHVKKTRKERWNMKADRSPVNASTLFLPVITTLLEQIFFCPGGLIFSNGWGFYVGDKHGGNSSAPAGWTIRYRSVHCFIWPVGISFGESHFKLRGHRCLSSLLLLYFLAALEHTPSTAFMRLECDKM